MFKYFENEEQNLETNQNTFSNENLFGWEENMYDLCKDLNPYTTIELPYFKEEIVHKQQSYSTESENSAIEEAMYNFDI